MRRIVLALLALVFGAASTGAQTKVPSSEPKPAFAPGLYLVESRNSRSPSRGIRSERCLRATDYDAFQRRVLTEYRTRPQFKAACRSSAPKPVAGGFAFAMECGVARSIIAYRFAQGLVRVTTETRIPARPENASSELTLMRRIGACPGQPP